MRYEDNDSALIIQCFRMIHHEIPTIRPNLPPIRQKIYARVRINVYFRRLVIK